MLAHLTYVLLVGLALPAVSVADKEKPAGENVKKAEKQVQERLEELKGTGAKVDPISDDDDVAAALPGHLFFTALFRQFPVGRAVPDGLKVQNIFVVNPKGELKLITDAKGLEDYFKAALKPANEEKDAKNVALAWLRLSQEFSQDGFYKFKLVEEGTKVTPQKEGQKVVARTVATQGGNGEVNVEVTFGADGKLTKATVSSMLRPGPRPICQATKLLDADPLVRRICEQDLLIMGRAAKDYLDEQRAKASPEVQKAIDRVWERIQNEDR